MHGDTDLYGGKSLKVGIMTFWWSNDNYGQLLQAYALSTYISELGHEAELIDYSFLSHPFMQFCERIVKRVAGSTRYEQRYRRHFDQFRTHRLKFSEKHYQSMPALKKSPPDYDVMICGSDQVWHYHNIPIPWFMRRFTDAYMLNFGKDSCIRVAYAASMGVTKVREKDLALITDKLARFTSIGMRERSSVAMVSDVCGELGHVQWVPDPTLLVSPQVYDAILPKEGVPIPEFFMYSLGNTSIIDGKEIARILAAEKRTYAYTSCQYANDYSANAAPRIEEWLYLIKHAGTVITNSFHGIMFAIVFNTEFFYYPLAAEVKGADTRITSVLDLLGIRDRALMNYQDVLRIVREPQERIDWHLVNEKLDTFRAVGHTFLMEALDSQASATQQNSRKMDI